MNLLPILGKGTTARDCLIIPNVSTANNGIVKGKYHTIHTKFSDFTFFSEFSILSWKNPNLIFYFTGWGGICGGGCFGTKKMSVKATTTSCISLCSKYLIHPMIYLIN